MSSGNTYLSIAMQESTDINRSPIAGMPIIDAYKSKQVIVMKRGMGSK